VAVIGAINRPSRLQVARFAGGVVAVVEPRETVAAARALGADAVLDPGPATAPRRADRRRARRRRLQCGNLAAFAALRAAGRAGA
jgi:hypothetical protein